jgi:hypothetical protein
MGPYPASFVFNRSGFEQTAASLFPLLGQNNAGIAVEDGALLPDYFVFTIPGDLLRGAVEKQNNAFLVHDHKAVPHGLEDIHQKAGLFA